jgi:hypothetical protein
MFHCSQAALPAIDCLHIILTKELMYLQDCSSRFEVLMAVIVMPCSLVVHIDGLEESADPTLSVEE